MVEDKIGVGERREASARRKRLAVILGLGVTGFFSGMYVGRGEAKALVEGGSVWSPELAIGLAVLFVVVIGGASLFLRKSMDEVEIQTQHKASALAGAVFLVAYPLWFLLWKGGFVVEPIHWVMYILFIFTSLAAATFYRFR
jgi:hypothetical protein